MFIFFNNLLEIFNFLSLLIF
ncbi:hypothetical protein CY0110_20002 [Crocosphaera chwakensis CCY0110]|uniref:Uncharacterized protein n=1 Tax=Crocosphaera chwakensis CCY0110 TaxID=391612 RepID=A3IJY2_9CHRO|nr:hypothetical protein CY0110_20002 [Crocosphaera chwakensis CCY0110]